MGRTAQVVTKTGKFFSDKGLPAVLDGGNGPFRRRAARRSGLERFYEPGRQIDAFPRESSGMSGLTELIRDVRDHPDH